MKNIERQKQFLENQELFKLNKKKFEEARDTHKLSQKRYFNKFMKVLKIMGPVESEVIQKHGLGKQYRSSYLQYGRRTTSLLKIKPAKEGVFLKYRTIEDWGDGDYNHTYYKTFIPYNYFDMSDAELKKEHACWSEMKIKELEAARKEKIEIFKKKMKQEEDAHQKALYLELKNKFEPNEVTN